MAKRGADVKYRVSKLERRADAALVSVPLPFALAKTQFPAHLPFLHIRFQRINMVLIGICEGNFLDNFLPSLFFGMNILTRRVFKV